MQKPDKTFQIFKLLAGVGFVSIAVGVIIAVWSHDSSNGFFIIFSAFGSASAGGSLSWIIEDRYKRVDERYSTFELFDKALKIYENTTNCDQQLPSEKQLNDFRSSPLHLYYSSKDENGNLYWNYTSYDFRITENTILGRLNTKAKFYNSKGTKYFVYDVEMFRRYTNDHIHIINRLEKSDNPITISIFEPYNSNYSPQLFGFSLHDDWQGKNRISPSILSFQRLFKNDIGPVQRIDALKLQTMWNESYKNKVNTVLFEEYI